MISNSSGDADSIGPRLISQLSAMGLRLASGKADARRLSSGVATLDQFLDGGLPVGAVTEWGAPLGKGGREVLLTWLAHATTASAGMLGLWVCARPHLEVYPPAWQARGVSLRRLRFANSVAPLRDLRPVFMEPLFRIVVLDGPRQFSEEDCAFVARQARLHDQIVLVVRDALLDPGQGNIWAKLRINCWYDALAHRYQLCVLRGLSPRQMALSVSDLRQMSTLVD